MSKLFELLERILTIFSFVASLIKKPFHLLACYIASRQEEQRGDYKNHAGIYQIESVDSDVKASTLSACGIRVRKGFTKNETRDGLFFAEDVVHCGPWGIHLVDAKKFRGMDEWDRHLTPHLITVQEIVKDLEEGTASLVVKVEDGEEKYFVVLNRGESGAWALYRNQMEWNKHQAKKREKHAEKLLRQATDKLARTQQAEEQMSDALRTKRETSTRLKQEISELKKLTSSPR